MTDCNSWCEHGKTVPISPLSIPSPFFFLFFSPPVFPLLPFHCSSFSSRIRTLSLCFPSIVSPRFSSTSMDTCLWKGPSADSPATLLLPPYFLRCTRQALLVNTGVENWEAEQKAEEWAWVWGASSADVIASWVDRCLLALGRSESSSWSRGSRCQGMSM